MTIVPFSLRNSPSLIEKLLPVQKLSIEAFKEQMSSHDKTLVTLGGYWKGRKPLILNKACVLGCLLPITDDPIRDLEIFEMLMGMDFASFVPRWKIAMTPSHILEKIAINRIRDYFYLEPEGVLPNSAPIEMKRKEYASVKVEWRKDIPLKERRDLEALLLPKVSYRERVELANRPEANIDCIHSHIWPEVNEHLGTTANNFPELVEQLGIMRFGHRPRVADTFCGSGQIPFEAARLGCDTFASDLNPIACMLSWGAFNIIGGSIESRKELDIQLKQIIETVSKQVDDLKIETDGSEWRAKTFLYCLEVKCPQTGWMVPLLPTLIVSNGYKTIAELIPDPINRRYDIVIKMNVSDEEMKKAEIGTLRTEGRGQDPYMVHNLNGEEYRTKISTLRGDYKKDDGRNGNQLRRWDKRDFRPQPEDIFQERLYCMQWMRKKKSGKGDEYQFRSVTSEDLYREQLVVTYIDENIEEWQDKGWIPDMRIEPGEKTDEPIRTRGWTYWHHLFNPRQLLLAGLTNKAIGLNPKSKIYLGQALNYNSKLSTWNRHNGGGGVVQHTFINQALNTLYNYGCRSSKTFLNFFTEAGKSYPFLNNQITSIENLPAALWTTQSDIFITDPPYGDAVKYEEILEFFIAWLRKNQAPEFKNWIWDSRRSLAIKGEDEDFRRGMVTAYSKMTECMPDNGLQVIMFTHQSGSIWADMANIVWASGLHVTAAWYVVTETESALREGSYVKGTVLLICRKRLGDLKTTRDDLAWELQEEVNNQVQSLTGLNQKAKGLYRDENVFEDADIQMAGYAAALRVLTRYKKIDGRDMTAEALRPRIKGEITFVDDLINYAVDIANQCLVPQGIDKKVWDKLTGAERFYLKMLDMEARGAKTLDNYQNFAKAFKVREFKSFMASDKANEARLLSSVEYGRSDMNEGSEFYQSNLRAVLYAVMELSNNVDGKDVLAHLILNIPNYYGDITQRQTAIELSDYLVRQLESIRPKEATFARILSELLKNQRLG